MKDPGHVSWLAESHWWIKSDAENPRAKHFLGLSEKNGHFIFQQDPIGWSSFSKKTCYLWNIQAIFRATPRALRQLQGFLWGASSLQFVHSGWLLGSWRDHAGAAGWWSKRDHSWMICHLMCQWCVSDMSVMCQWCVTWYVSDMSVIL